MADTSAATPAVTGIPKDSLHPEPLPQEIYLTRQQHPEAILMPEELTPEMKFAETVGKDAMQAGYPIVLFRCPHCGHKAACTDYGRVLHPVCHHVVRVVPAKK